MGRFWTSTKTGKTYDTWMTDENGNWLEASLAEKYAYQASMPSASGGGALPLLGVLALGGLTVAGAVGAFALAAAAMVGGLSVGLPIAMARWPLWPVLLWVVAFLVVRSTRALQRWRPAALFVLVVPLVMLPLTFVSMWANGQRTATWYDPVMELPLVPLLALAILVLGLVKRLIPAVVGAVMMLWIAGMPYLDRLLSGPDPSQYERLGYDNLLAVLSCSTVLVLFGLWRVGGRQSRSTVPGETTGVSGPPPAAS